VRPPAGESTKAGPSAVVSLADAQHFFVSVFGCVQQGVSGTGVAVRCAFDYHLFRSDEIGRGPYTDNYWDIVVSDGKITSAVQTQAYLTNGSSAEMWQPFQAWVTSTHPEDSSPAVGDPTTEEAMRLWESARGRVKR
jgi:hypothetical protein